MSYLNWSGGKTVINYPEMNLKDVENCIREGIYPLRGAD